MDKIEKLVNIHEANNVSITNSQIIMSNDPESTCEQLPFRPGLLEYVQRKFDAYKAADIAVHTPQLLLMLLEFPDSSALKIFNNYRYNDIYYGDYLIKAFHYIDQTYADSHRTYDPISYAEFEHIVAKFHPEKWDSYITERTLCYAIMESGGNTVKMIQNHLGQDYFESLMHYLKLGRPQSVSLGLDLPEDLKDKTLDDFIKIEDI